MSPTFSLEISNSSDRESYVNRGEKIVRQLLSECEGSNTDWQAAGAEKNIQLFKKVTVGGVSCWRGVGVVKAPAQAVFDCVLDPNTRFAYDSMLKKISVLSVVSDDTQVVYMHHEARSCLVKTARDFVLLQSAKVVTSTSANGTEEKSYVLAAQSIDIPGVPKFPKLARAEVLIGGWFVQPLAGDANSCRVTYVACVDTGLPLPAPVLNTLQRKQPLAIHAVRELLGAK